MLLSYLITVYFVSIDAIYGIAVIFCLIFFVVFLTKILYLYSFCFNINKLKNTVENIETIFE